MSIRKSLPNSAQPPMENSRAVGAPHPNDPVHVTLVLRRCNELPALDVIGAQPLTSRHGMSSEDFAASFGADPDDVALIESFAHRHGLSVSSVKPAQRSVRLSGTAANMNKAFGVAMQHYDYGAGTYRGHEGPVYLPEELHGVVMRVLGLDTRPVATPKWRSRAHAGETSGSQSYLPTQLATIYQFPEGTGQGQKIAIIELSGGYDPKVLDDYFQNTLGFDKTPNIKSVSVDGAVNTPYDSQGRQEGADGEVYLDIEVIGALAPAADINVYFAPNQGDGFRNGIAQAIDDGNSIISISWGGPEHSSGLFEDVLQDAAHQHITVLVAAGDNGSSDFQPLFVGGDQRVHARTSQAFVDYPACSQWTLACGGTKLNANPDTGQIESELVWNETTRTIDTPLGQLIVGGAGGGGVSTLIQRPSYQTGLNIPPNVNGTNFNGRGIPDICAVADPTTGYRVRVGPGPSGLQPIGGTSAVAPLWSALLARINENLGVQVGFINPILYRIAESEGALNDITDGDNGTRGGYYRTEAQFDQDNGINFFPYIPEVQGYSAGSGWDAATGWGSPVGTKLQEELQQHM